MLKCYIKASHIVKIKNRSDSDKVKRFEMAQSFVDAVLSAKKDKLFIDFLDKWTEELAIKFNARCCEIKLAREGDEKNLPYDKEMSKSRHPQPRQSAPGQRRATIQRRLPAHGKEQ